MVGRFSCARRLVAGPALSGLAPFRVTLASGSFSRGVLVVASVACCDVIKLSHVGPGHKSAVTWGYVAKGLVSAVMGRSKVFGFIFAPQVKGYVIAVTCRAGGPI